MKRLWLGIALLLSLTACVGKLDDPEELAAQEDFLEEAGAESGTRYYHRVLALEFTATWCQYCPAMQQALDLARALRPGRIVHLAVHQYDEMSPLEADALVERYQIGAFPQLVLDADAATLFSEPDASRITTYVDKVKGNDAPGLAAESALEGEVLHLSVHVRPLDETPLRVCAAVVEDGIEAFQQGVGNWYRHHAVLRGYLDGGLDGLPLPAPKDGEASLSITAPVPSVPEHSRLVVYLLQEGRAVNALTLGLTDKKDYRYE